MKCKNEIITAVVFNPDSSEEPHIIKIPDDLHVIQSVIKCGGVEVYGRQVGGKNYMFFCDEIGRYKGLTPAAFNNEGQIMFVGKLVIAGLTKDGDVKSLSDDDVERIRTNVFKNKINGKQFIHCEY